MDVNLKIFFDDPHTYILQEGRGYKAFDWLESNLGTPATIKLFSDIILNRITEFDNHPQNHNSYIPVGNMLMRSRSINSIGMWSTFPQGRALWEDLDRFFSREEEMGPNFKEQVLDTIFKIYI